MLKQLPIECNKRRVDLFGRREDDAVHRVEQCLTFEPVRMDQVTHDCLYIGRYEMLSIDVVADDLSTLTESRPYENLTDYRYRSGG